MWNPRLISEDVGVGFNVRKLRRYFLRYTVISLQFCIHTVYGYSYYLYFSQFSSFKFFDPTEISVLYLDFCLLSSSCLCSYSTFSFSICYAALLRRSIQWGLWNSVLYLGVIQGKEFKQLVESLTFKWPFGLWFLPLRSVWALHYTHA